MKLVVDSIVEDLARIRISSRNNRTTLNIDVEALEAILRGRGVDLSVDIEEGNSYVIILEDMEDFKDLWSGTSDRDFTYREAPQIKDTTKEDRARIRKRLSKLRRSR